MASRHSSLTIMFDGILTYLADLFPPKPTFNVEDIPDLTGKVVIVTGANSGVGKETAKALLGRNAKVYFATRSKEKTEKAIHALKSETGNEGVYLHLDLGDLKSVKAAAKEFLSKEPALHVLFNNAGVLMPPVEALTIQGYDLAFGTNVLGHFYFTKLLIPALCKGAQSSGDGKARVVTTSSSGSYFVGPIDFNVLKDGPARRRQSSFYLSNHSKLGSVLISNEFAKRYGDQGIVFSSVHPGSLDSDLFRYAPPWQTAILRRLMLYPASFGALTQLFAGTMDEGVNLNGKWLRPWARVSDHPNPHARDEKASEELWKWCEEQIETI